MQYRKYGKLDWKVSALGFGAMRLPSLDGIPAHVNEPEAAKMMYYAIDRGVNYVDTGYPYLDGACESVVGRILRGGYRNKVHLAAKLPCFLINSPADFDRYLNEQLSHLQTDRIDFYLLHGLDKDSWSKLSRLEVLRWAENAMRDGRIRHLGFSFHDEYAVFQQIVDASDKWTFCQIQLNYMDENYQAGVKGLKYAASKGLAVNIMEPLRGGALTRQSPASVAKLWDGAPQKRSQAEWGLLWVWNHPEVSVVLSGMSTMEQVQENSAIAEQSQPGMLSTEELKLIAAVKDAYNSLAPIPCTGCRYCMPCPNGVWIPRMFELYNQSKIYNSLEDCRITYRQLRGLKAEQRADNCIKCETCVTLCPQKLPIPDWLEKTDELLR